MERENDLEDVALFRESLLVKVGEAFELARELRKEGSNTLEWWRILAEDKLERVKDRVAMGVAWRMPRRLAWWGFMRVVCHATQDKWSDQNVVDLSVLTAMERWRSGRGAATEVDEVYVDRGFDEVSHIIGG